MSQPASTCTDDRIVLGRRGAIGPAEWRDLMEHLTTCSACKVAWLAIQSFEGTGGTQPEDERLVRSAVHAAMASRRSPSRFALRPAAAVGALAMLVAAVASAGIAIHRRLAAPPAVASPAEEVPSGAGRARRVEARPPAPLEEPRVEPAPLAVPATEPAEEPRAAPPRSALQEGRSGRLFAQALAARGAGHAEQALALFHRLQRDFPDTEEATVSLISAGELLVEASAFRTALAKFDAYLRRAPDGPLVPEALASKSRLLDQLGRSEEAERVRGELRRRVPEWPYAPQPRSASGGRRAP